MRTRNGVQKDDRDAGGNLPQTLNRGQIRDMREAVAKCVERRNLKRKPGK